MTNEQKKAMMTYVKENVEDYQDRLSIAMNKTWKGFGSLEVNDYSLRDDVERYALEWIADYNTEHEGEEDFQPLTEEDYYNECYEDLLWGF